MWQSHILTKANEIVATSAQELSREVRLLAQGTSWVTMLDCFSATALKLNRATFELLVLACCELCRKHAQRCSELL